MIVVNKVLSLDKSEVLAIEIVIESSGHTCFVAAEQDEQPGVRAGSFPNHYDWETLKVSSYPREEVLKFKETF